MINNKDEKHPNGRWYEDGKLKEVYSRKFIAIIFLFFKLNLKYITEEKFKIKKAYYNANLNSLEYENDGYSYKEFEPNTALRIIFIIHSIIANRPHCITFKID